MVRANFLNDPSGTAPPQDWVGSEPQAAVLSWNPEFSEAPIGDMVEFAVAERGFEILADPTTETWAAVEVDYRVGLQEELFGDVGGSFGWPWGLTMVVVILLLALTLSGFEWRRKRRLKQRRAVSEPPIAGLFEEQGVE